MSIMTEGQVYRLHQVLYCMPNDLVSVFRIFFQGKAIHIP